MQKPTADEVYNMMQDAIGEANMSPAMKKAYKSAPSLLVNHGISCNQSIKSEENALDMKTSVLIFLASSLAFKDDACLHAFTQLCDDVGISNEELTSMIRIVKHAAASGIIGASDVILEYMGKRS
jgi:alkylhydroperoxidase/carboxymuconolactone decarboxylase family protein YurZ